MSQTTPENIDWSQRANIANYISRFLGACVILAGIWTFHAGNKAQDVVKAQFEAKTQEAKTEAAKAVQAGLVLSVELQKTQIELQRTQADVTLEKQKLVAMNIEVIKAKEQQAIAEKALLELQERVKPRSLSEDQKTRLFNYFYTSATSSIVVQYTTTDSEAQSYALEIISILKRTGWAVEERPGIVFGAIPKGISIRVKDAASAPISANVIVEGFREIGIKVEGYIYPDAAPDYFILMIGPKP